MSNKRRAKHRTWYRVDVAGRTAHFWAGTPGAAANEMIRSVIESGRLAHRPHADRDTGGFIGVSIDCPSQKPAKVFSEPSDRLAGLLKGKRYKSGTLVKAA